MGGCFFPAFQERGGARPLPTGRGARKGAGIPAAPRAQGRPCPVPPWSRRLFPLPRPSPGRRNGASMIEGPLWRPGLGPGAGRRHGQDSAPVPGGPRARGAGRGLPPSGLWKTGKGETGTSAMGGGPFLSCHAVISQGVIPSPGRQSRRRSSPAFSQCPRPSRTVRRS